MKRNETDILIAGGGIAGMLAALIFAHQGLRVICCDASPKPSKTGAKDLRSTAFLMPSIALLEEVGVFAPLEPIATPLKTMRIVDAGGVDFEPRQISDFEATEANEAQFGFNIPNAPLREHLLAQISAHPAIEMIFGDAVTSRVARLTASVVRLESGRQVTSALVVAADGRNSRLRDLAGIDVTTKRYGQKALVFTVDHQEPHGGISTEIHRDGGPFTLVPLAGHDHKRSAVVWMDKGEMADHRFELSDAEFEAALNTRSCGVMGPLTLSSPRGIWPIISQYAHGLIGQRLALIGEAATCGAPIGAQGLNMSLADIACLAELMSDERHRGDIGSDSLLESYQRKRLIGIKARVSGIDALNRASIAGAPPLRDLRASPLVGS